MELSSSGSKVETDFMVDVQYLGDCDGDGVAKNARGRGMKVKQKGINNILRGNIIHQKESIYICYGFQASSVAASTVPKYYNLLQCGVESISQDCIHV